MEFGKRHHTTDTTDFSPQTSCRLLTDFYRETGVMDFGLYHTSEQKNKTAITAIAHRMQQL